MKRRFVYLDHPADAKFRAFGDTLEEAFSNAAAAVASLMWDVDRISKTSKRAIRTEGLDLEQLLMKFLGEILFLFETKRFLLAAAEEVKIEPRKKGFRLTAVFRGDDHPERYDVSGEVKAITYSQMKIEKNRRWTVEVVADM